MERSRRVSLGRRPSSRPRRTSGRPLVEFALVEQLEPRQLLAAQPTASLTVPPDALVGEVLTFQVAFDNTSATDVGYGPFVDLTLPPGVDGDDGLTFLSSSLFGSPISPIVLTFPPSGMVPHPFAVDNAGQPVPISGPPGGQLVVLTLPFGSFAPNQPPAVVEVRAQLSNKADVGTPLPITAQGGFSLGNSPLQDPATDPSLFGPTVSASTTPRLLRVTKTYVGPESETATGPAYPRQYRVTLDVAEGQSISQVDLTDVLPPELQFLSILSTQVQGVETPTTPISTPSTSVPGGTLTRRFPDLVGTASTADASMLFGFYVAQNNSSGQPVLQPGVGAPVVSTDQAQGQAFWTPLDPRDPPGIYESNIALHDLTDRAIATQKSVDKIDPIRDSAEVLPGDILEYTLNFQVSDFFAFQNLILTDIISDGQRFDTSFVPTLLIDGNGFNLPTAVFDAGSYTVVGNYTGAVPPPASPNGTSTITFNVSGELIQRGQSGQLVGGMVDPSGGSLPFPGNGPVTGTIVFRTQVQKTFTDDPEPGAVVGQGDRLDDNLQVSADVLDNNTLQPTGSNVTDTSFAESTIAAGSLAKSIYAINGNAVGPNPEVTPGDVVTYRLRYSLPNSNFRALNLDDFLPLPIFDATSVTTFNPIVSPTVPPPGSAQFGPSDTFFALSGVTPALTTSSVSNSLSLAWGQYINPTNTDSTIDILFSVTVTDQPFADRLLLTNQGSSTEATSNHQPIIDTQIAQLILTEPNVVITKGVIATSNTQAQFTQTPGPVGFSAPGSAGYRGTGTINTGGLAVTPIDANLANVQAGDLVSFAIVLENLGTGSSGAFDVVFRDTIPAGFEIPPSGAGLNLTITDGTGAAFSVIDLGGGLFGNGFRIVDPGPTDPPAGSLDPVDLTSGRNIAVITYDLRVESSVLANQRLTNTGTLAAFASAPGGPDFLPSDLTDNATVTVLSPALTKHISSTDQPFTTGSNLAIGEVATYTVVLTVPQGITANARLIDTLPNGLALVSVDSLVPSDPALVSASAGTFGQILAAANGSIPPGGGAVTFTFGNIANTEVDPTNPVTISATYRVVALNTTANTNGRAQTNSAQLTYNGGSVSAQTTARIRVPVLELTKAVDKPSAEAGDLVTYTLTIRHAAGSGTDAFDVNLDDLVPPEVTYEPGTLQRVSGPVPTIIDDSGNPLRVVFDTFTRTDVSELTFQARVVDSIAANTTVVNSSRVEGTSLPGATPAPISPYNTLSVERTGNPADPGGAANNINKTAQASFTPAPTLDKIITGTDQPFTTGNDVAIGERVFYRIQIDIPQGVSPAAALTDNLPDGLALVSIDAITATNEITTSIPGGFDAIRSNAQVNNLGRVWTLNFGDLANDARDGSPQFITIDVTAVVLNAASNQTGISLANAAEFVTNGVTTDIVSAPVEVLTPVLQVIKTAAPTSSDAGGAPITFTITINHAVDSATDAFNVSLADPLPAGLDYVPGSLQAASGQTPTSLNFNAGTISATFDTFPLTASSTITFQATFDASTTPGQQVTNTAQAQGTSLPGPTPIPISPFNPLSVERTGNPADPGGAANDIADSGGAVVTVYAGSLAGTVYVDLANDGILDPGDPRIPGVTVTLTGTDSLGNSVNVVALTNASGYYSFTDLRPGNYTLTETQPAAYLSGKNTVGSQGGIASPPPDSVISNIVLPVGIATIGVGNNFGELNPSSLAGTVYIDINWTGTQQPGDPGLPGVTITLTGTDDLGSVNVVTTTDANGDFLFDRLRPGTYTLTETQPTDFLSGVNAAGSLGGTVVGDTITGIPVPDAGANGVNYLFGERIAADLAVLKTIDDPTPDVGQNIRYNVELSNIGPSNATGVAVTDLIPAGLTFVSATPDQGTYDPATGIWSVGPVDRGDVFNLVLVATVDTLNPVTNTSTITASNQRDPNPNNNTSDVTETPGQAALKLTKTVSNPTPNVGDVVTYTISVVNSGPNPARNVVVVDNAPPGLQFVAARPSQGTYDPTTDTWTIGTIGVNQTVTLEVEARILAGDFSRVNTATADSTTHNRTPGESVDNAIVSPLSSLSGIVFVDLNNDGIYQPGEPPIPGVTITLNGSTQQGGVTQVTVTGPDGRYSFISLAAGTYSLVQTQPPDFIDGKVHVGTAGGVAGVNTITQIPLGLGTVGTQYDFGELTVSSLSGYVYWDANHNRRFDSADFGIANVTMTLMGFDRTGQLVNLQTQTDTNGFYEFGDLLPGTYRIVETQPIQFVTYTEQAGSLGGETRRNRIVQIPVGVNQKGINYNFGELQRPGCKLRCIAFHVGRATWRHLERRALNPARYDANHPAVAPFLERGEVPRGVGGFPKAPVVYSNVPTIGRKRLVLRVDPATGQQTLIGVPNFPSVTTIRIPRRNAR